jgi:hypothetical protein
MRRFIGCSDCARGVDCFSYARAQRLLRPRDVLRRVTRSVGEADQLTQRGCGDGVKGQYWRAPQKREALLAPCASFRPESAGRAPQSRSSSSASVRHHSSADRKRELTPMISPRCIATPTYWLPQELGSRHMMRRSPLIIRATRAARQSNSQQETLMRSVTRRPRRHKARRGQSTAPPPHPITRIPTVEQIPPNYFRVAASLHARESGTPAAMSKKLQ